MKPTIEPLTDNAIFQTANELKFWDACMNFEDGINRNFRQNRPLQLVGDRMRLIKCLQESGYTVTKINTHE